MLVVAKAATIYPLHEDGGEGFFAGLPEGSVPEVVAKGDGLGEILVYAKRASDGAGDLHHLQRVRKAGAQVIAIWGDKDLRLVHQAPEGLGVYYAITVPLKLVSHPIRRFRDRSPDARFAGPLRCGEEVLLSTLGSVLLGPQAGRGVRGLRAARRAVLGVPGAWARTWEEATRWTLSSSLFSTVASLIGRTMRSCRAARVSGGRGNESAVAAQQLAQSTLPRVGAK